ncbi:MAG: Na+/H+ antiporter NhaA [Myxococcales bacterium]
MPARTRQPLAVPAPLLRVMRPFQAFLANQSASGVLLLASTVVALVWANSRFAESYHHLLETPITVRFGELGSTWPLHHWINDGLMAVFFFLVGMEIKQELVLGELRSFGRALLPLIAAAGGMAAPAALFLAFNAGDTSARGWGIPTATDIAFALGCLAVLRGKVPASLAVFLTALAIFDDLGAILVIALFYGAGLNVAALLGAAGIVGVLVVMNLYGVRRPLPYALVGIVLWLLVLLSGIHATIAGVILGLCIPARPPREPEELLSELDDAVTALRSDDVKDGAETLGAIERYLEQVQAPLPRIVHALHKPVGFLIIPIFALANAGISLQALSPSDVFSPVTLGVMLGLFLGKQLGIFAATYAAVKLGLSPMPAGASWRQLYGVAMLGGIGFTMSLFISALAFPADAALNNASKLGILAGSLLSAGAGMAFLALGKPGPVPAAQPSAEA